MGNNAKKSLYMLLAILIVLVFWFYVDEQGHNGTARQIQMEVTDIPITYLSESGLESRGLMLLDEGSSQTVDLTLEGARRLVTKIDRDQVRIMVNLSNVTIPGVQTIGYNISFTNPKFSGDSIKVKDASINMATVNISELEKREVPVRCELTGNVAEGYSAGQLELSHTSIEIRGQAEDIDPVSYVKLTLHLGEDATSSVSKNLPVQYYDNSGKQVSGEKIHTDVDSIRAKLPVSVTKELRLVLDFKDAAGARIENVHYEITPASITVSGDADRLRYVDTISLGEVDLLSLLGSETSTHSYPIIIPSECQNLSGVTRATVKIGFEDMLRTTVATSQFQFVNLPAGKDVALLTQVVDVNIFGTTEDVTAISGDHIRITIDLDNYSEASGTYTVPVNVTILGGYDIGVSGSYQVRVTIREPETSPELPPGVTPEAEGDLPTINTGEST